MLNTEKRNPKTTHIDKMSPLEIARVIQDENYNAVRAIDSEVETVGAVIDEVSKRMARGGRLFYIGCGTSGRLGVLDASECPPTFGVDHGTVVGIIAGGDGALRRAAEGAEDNAEAGRGDLLAHGINKLDSVIGISVAGGAAYVAGALEYAKEQGAFTVALTCNAGSKITNIADLAICTDTGAEVITGSSRMKAGSAHKMILNMISTGVMVRLGYVYENLMINLRPSNVKLEARMVRIVNDITGCGEQRARELLDENGWVIKSAIQAYNG